MSSLVSGISIVQGICIGSLLGLLVACGAGSSDDSAMGATVQLAWLPNPDNITGYNVYYGSTPETATTLVSVLPVDSPNFDPQAPTVQYVAFELGLGLGDQVCFRVKAHDGEEFSDFSKAVCGRI